MSQSRHRLSSDSPHWGILLLGLSVTLMLCACSTPELPRVSLPDPDKLPFVFKIDVQQGNVINQDMLAQLEPRMDKKKVLFIMGTPIIEDTFHNERWDYLYTFRPGGGAVERRQITLFFDDDELDHIEGDIVPAAGPLVANLHNDTRIKVPLLTKKSFTERVVEKLPFVKDEEDDVVVEVDLSSDDDEDAEPEEPLIPKIAQASVYENIQSAPGEGIVVPPDAPVGYATKKKSLFARLFSWGDDDQADSYLESEAGTEAPKAFKDISDPDTP
jgi:outer membrane protein assembly factor BamE